MRQTIEALMDRLGTEVTLVQGESTRKVRCFFQPVRSGSYQSMEPQAPPLGQLSQGQHTYLGPLDARVQPGNLLRLGSKSYLVRRVEDYCGKGEALYQWGLCVERSEEAVWGV